jgi:hypothetical protein
MRILVFVCVAALGLTACSTTGNGKLAVCDGKHLRPANPYGTVLAPPAEGAAAPSAEGTPRAKPKTLSSAASPKLFGSCA